MANIEMDKSAPVCYCTKPWNCVWNELGRCEMHGKPCDEICVAQGKEQHEETEG